ncbi:MULTISPECIES: TetR/AcrR family transcriptional regulator [unclassified Ruminococcus]|uniref:TetR/AcrR family transcriptional regulator n=1 Tax=unclassified Ruminococcus TaxID=2608920 RepID=UPI00210E3C06|nr:MULTISPECIES: TetR/AcrR family transcriptional regulator [unclassified Ruminococcus]MCQ4023146.1 TetR family transcriptional regulator [Ruminococcus sp. zg-924]MCQ4115083.1 TetR family transcriptional regulator [Ruminococcus sp. zg-921]
MPTDAFFQLKEDKKKRFIEAAVEEFSATPYEKVSVFKIAHSAGISRSGFYYYFKNKADLYSYVYFVKFQNEFYEYMNSIEKKHDIFSVFVARFEYYLAIKGTENESLAKQMMKNIVSFDLIRLFKDKSISLFNRFNLQDDMKHIAPPMTEFFENFNTDNLTATNSEDILMLAMLMNMLTIKYISAYFDGSITMQEASDEYNKHINYLKYGFYKNEE